MTSTVAPPQGSLADWNPVQGAALTSAIVRTRHRLGDLSAFSDPEIERLLDEHPRHLVRAYAPNALGARTMPAVDVGDASGGQIMDVLRSGMLWLNVRVDEDDPAFRAIQASLLEELGRVVPDLLPGSGYSNLLLSSPGSAVSFHLDTPPGILWHVRGRKRVFVYPALNEALVPREMLEDLYAGVHREFVEYEAAFDEAALVFDLEPGDAISWPQNAPHRIDAVNDLNVSLATEFRTKRSERRARLYRANRFLNRQLHLPARSTTEAGAVSAIKRGVYGVARRLGAAGGGTLPPVEAPFRLDGDRRVVEQLDRPVEVDVI